MLVAVHLDVLLVLLHHINAELPLAHVAGGRGEDGHCQGVALWAARLEMVHFVGP